MKKKKENEKRKNYLLKVNICLVYSSPFLLHWQMPKFSSQNYV